MNYPIFAHDIAAMRWEDCGALRARKAPRGRRARVFTLR